MTRLALHWQILGGMFIGALVGIVLNAGAGSRDTVVDAKKLPKGVAALTISDTPNRVEIKVTPTKGEYYEVIVDGTGKQKKSFPTVKQLKSKKEKEYKWFKRFGRSTSRTTAELRGELISACLKFYVIMQHRVADTRQRQLRVEPYMYLWSLDAVPC